MRNTETLVGRKSFERLWNASTPEKKKEVLDALNNYDKNSIVGWMLDHPDLDLGEMSSRTLKDIGRKIGVKNYSRLSKQLLIREIRRLGYEKE